MISSKPFVVDDQTTIILKMLKLGQTERDCYQGQMTDIGYMQDTKI
jgi:hypothetical protein